MEPGKQTPMDLPLGLLSLSSQRYTDSWPPPSLLINYLFVAMVFLSLPQREGQKQAVNQIISCPWAEGSSEVT